MSSAQVIKAAKEALDQAVTNHKFNKSVVKKSVENEVLNERTFRNKLKALNDSLTALNSTHTSWVSKADLTDEQLSEERYSLSWLEKEWHESAEIQEQMESKLSNLTTQSNKDKLLICSHQMDSLRLNIERKVDNLHKKTDSSAEITSPQGFSDLLTDIGTCLNDFSALADKILSLDIANIESNSHQFEVFRQTQQNKIADIELRLATEKSTSPKPSFHPVKGIEMEKSKAPSFSGRTIDYPEFKRGWLKVPGVMWEDANQVEQIKFKVNEHCRRLISRCSTMAEVWQTLDAEFAEEHEVINAVDEELRKLTSEQCSTPQYIVNLRNYLPTLMENLRSVGGVEHLCSPDRVHFMASKFDDRTMYEWEYFKSKNSGATTYDRFFAFLLDRYEASRATIARLKSTSSVSTSLSVNLTSSRLDDTECHKCRSWVARDRIHTCPGCGRGTAVGEKIGHCLEHCGAYMGKSADERSACVETAGWCPVHLVGSHTLSDCTMANDPRSVCGINNCRKHHHKSLHGSTTAFVASVNTTSSKHSSSTNGAVLFAIQNISTTSGPVNCLFDNCSECCLITKDAAARLNLVGEPLNIILKTVTGDKVIESYAYTVTLVDNNNNKHQVSVHDVDYISNAISKVSLSNVKHLFDESVQKLWDRIDNRPSGEIDMLLGENYSGIHPTDWVVQGNMRIKSSKFGSGYVLTGSHSSIISQHIRWNDNVAHIRSCSSDNTQFGVNRISIKPMQEYFARDALGVEPPRRCGNCMNCKECGFRGQQLSQEEQYQYHELESRVHYDQVSQCFRVSYPFTDDPAILRDNFKQVVKIAERLERKLIKQGRLEMFNKEFDNMCKNVLVELSQAEIDMWDGPVHYIPLQDVVNEESPTTPMRIVGNSSLSDSRGVSLNSITMKGPNTLSDQFDILCKWRAHEVGLCSDITKAYHSLRTGKVEMHLRRVVWRHGTQDAPWRIFAFCTVSFGDRPAAALLEIALRKVATIHRSIDPEAADRIHNERYVDDFASGGTHSQVSRLVGEEGENFQCNGTLPNILSKGSFKLKAIVRSGETDETKLAKLGSKVLGVGYNATSDKISVDFTVKISTDGKNDKTVLSLDSLYHASVRAWLTKSNILSIINSIYDPLGLASPITIKLRVEFRNLFSTDSSLGWGDPIQSVTVQNLWIKLIEELISAGKVTFPRAITPPHAIGKPQLVAFFDGSDNAFAAAIYIRWVLNNGDVHVTLMTAKAHVTPLIRISTPRSEVNGSVLANRLLLSSVKSLHSVNHTPERVHVIGDSECVLAGREKVNGAFGEYFGNRYGEIFDLQSKIEKICPVGLEGDGEWYHTGSKNNAADQASRLDSSIADISEGSEWQNGPPYLKSEQSEWPLNRDFAQRCEQHIPKGELLKRYRHLVNKIELAPKTGINLFIDIHSTNVWETLIRKTQWLITWPMLMNFFNASRGIAVPNRTAYAKTLWYRTVMHKTREAMNSGRLKELDIREREDGLLVIVGRAQTGLHKLYGADSLPVIMADTKVAELVMVSAHWKDHSGLDITMAMSRMDAWIVNARKLAKQIVRACIRCRYLRKKLEGQKMAVLPDLMQVPARPFTNVGLDLCGPLTVKSMTNKRATMKVWITIFVCLNTKAVSMELAPGYATDDFLLAYETHYNCRGIPAYVYSDRGSQLVAAQKEVSTDTVKYDWDSIASNALKQGTMWEFAPAGGQWRNGATEAFVKKFKHSFLHLYSNTKMNFAEMLCAVKRISNILNNRPISVQRTRTDAQDDDFLHPLTPNSLLMMGNSGVNLPTVIAEDEDPRIRLPFIDEIERAWWYQYKVQYFQSLIPTRKWLEQQRNMRPGDVVLIEYKSKSLPGTYRLGRVREVEVDPKDELVRTCTVVYKLVKPITSANKNTVKDVVTKEVRVPVQRLVLILPVEEQ